jgi:hypothetical protein
MLGLAGSIRKARMTADVRPELASFQLSPPLVLLNVPPSVPT